MGQYYVPIILNPDESVTTFSNYTFGNSPKLTDHSWIGNSMVNVVYVHIHNKPRKVAWIGDYSDIEYETSDASYTKQLPFDEFMKYYSSARTGEEDETDCYQIRHYSHDDINIVNLSSVNFYLVNHTINVYFDLSKYIERCTIKEGYKKGYCLDPLPLLTACGNGRGGGDFFNNNTSSGYDQIGTWAFNILELCDTQPIRYVEKSINFIKN